MTGEKRAAERDRDSAANRYYTATRDDRRRPRNRARSINGPCDARSRVFFLSRIYVYIYIYIYRFRAGNSDERFADRFIPRILRAKVSRDSIYRDDNSIVPPSDNESRTIGAITRWISIPSAPPPPPSLFPRGKRTDEVDAANIEKRDYSRLDASIIRPDDRAVSPSALPTLDSTRDSLSTHLTRE